ncbi:MAG: CdaR family protein [Treponema sp.]|nr:CdaR family protein [Treponema sp.]
MKVNLLLKKIVDDWPIKILCFVIALLLYLFYQISLVESQTIVVPLKLKQEGGVELVSSIQHSVKVSVKSKDSTSVHPEDFSAVLDLDYLTESGTYNIPVTFTVSDHLIATDPVEIKIKPESVNVHVERKVSAGAVISVPTVGEVEYGYQVKDITVEPDTVGFFGPESIVKGTKDLSTAPVSLKGLTQTQDFIVNLYDPNKRLTVDRMNDYKVTVVVEPVISEKTVNGIMPFYQNLSDKLVLESPLTDITVKVQGPLLSVENITSDAFSFKIDLSTYLEPGEYEIPVVIDYIENVEIIEQTDAVWKIILSEKPEEEAPSTEWTDLTE